MEFESKTQNNDNYDGIIAQINNNDDNNDDNNEGDGMTETPYTREFKKEAVAMASQLGRFKSYRGEFAMLQGLTKNQDGMITIDNVKNVIHGYLGEDNKKLIALDILAVYLKGYKIIYTEAKNHCEKNCIY